MGGRKPKENCPMWKYRSLTPSGPLPKKKKSKIEQNETKKKDEKKMIYNRKEKKEIERKKMIVNHHCQVASLRRKSVSTVVVC